MFTDASIMAGVEQESSGGSSRFHMRASECEQNFLSNTTSSFQNRRYFARMLDRIQAVSAKLATVKRFTHLSSLFSLLL